MGSNTSATMDLKTLRFSDESSKDEAFKSNSSPMTHRSTASNGHPLSSGINNNTTVNAPNASSSSFYSRGSSTSLKRNSSAFLPPRNVMSPFVRSSSNIQILPSSTLNTSHNHSINHMIHSPINIEDESESNESNSDEEGTENYIGASIRSLRRSSLSHQPYSVLESDPVEDSFESSPRISSSRSFLLQKRMSHHHIQQPLVQTISDADYFSQQPPTSRNNSLIDIQESVIILNKRSCGSLKHMKSTSNLLGSSTSHGTYHPSPNGHPSQLSTLNRMARRKSTTDISPNQQTDVNTTIPVLRSSALDDTIVINCNESSGKRNRSPSPLLFKPTVL
nr:unnamed protein product [Naegleria fowleri]